MKNFKCDTCGQAFFLKGNLKKHEDSTHKGIRFPCTLCDKTFKRICGLKRHERATHELEKYACNLCNKMYTDKRYFKKHCKKNHDDEMSFKKISAPSYRQKGGGGSCETCDKFFKSKDILKVHEQTVHQNIRYECDSCDKKFSNNGNLFKHKKNIHEKSRGLLTCNFCNKSIATKTNLKRHIDLVHKNVRFSCEICNKGLQTKAGLLNHFKSYHPDSSVSNKSISNDRSTNQHNEKLTYTNTLEVVNAVQEIVCSECEEVFTSRLGFEDHYYRMHDLAKSE